MKILFLLTLLLISCGPSELSEAEKQGIRICKSLLLLTNTMQDTTLVLGVTHIPLRRWVAEDVIRKYPHQVHSYYQEVVQIVPWSSGPMIFTCLTLVLGYGNPNPENVDTSIPGEGMFAWVCNPSLSDEFDKERGHYYV